MSTRPDYDHETTLVAPDGRVNVTEQDYLRAVKSDQYKCAIAQAIQRARPDAMRVRVNKETISWTEGEKRYTYPTPEVAVDAIIKPLDTGHTEVLQPMVVRLTGGWVRPVVHYEGKELREKRDAVRERARKNPDYFHPASHLFNRFTKEDDNG